MSYIGEPFKHDFFVSYSHGDVDGAGKSLLKQWSQGFIEQLRKEVRFNAAFGSELELFFDDNPRPGQGLDPMAGLTEQLRGDLANAAILIVLMSEHYLKSKWCAEERDWWLKRQGEAGLALDQRIAVARIWPTTLGWPAAFADERGNPFVGISFFDPELASTRPWPYAWPKPDDESAGPFRTNLQTLVAWLWMAVEQTKTRMNERKLAQADAAKLGQDTGQVLYLHGRAEHAPAWEKAGEALNASGFTVFPTEPDVVESDPRKAQESRRRRIETLSGCDALLLLGTADGRALDADLVVVGRQDRHSARALSNRFLPCGLLDTVGAGIATETRRKAARGLQVDWLDSTRDPWPSEVQQWLLTKAAAAERSL
ncbi:MAG: molecular chaperone Tir [Gammaproteobacteria bacterium]